MSAPRLLCACLWGETPHPVGETPNHRRVRNPTSHPPIFLPVSPALHQSPPDLGLPSPSGELWCRADRAHRTLHSVSAIQLPRLWSSSRIQSCRWHRATTALLQPSEATPQLHQRADYSLWTHPQACATSRTTLSPLVSTTKERPQQRVAIPHSPAVAINGTRQRCHPGDYQCEKSPSSSHRTAAHLRPIPSAENPPTANSSAEGS